MHCLLPHRLIRLERDIGRYSLADSDLWDVIGASILVQSPIERVRGSGSLGDSKQPLNHYGGLATGAQQEPPRRGKDENRKCMGHKPWFHDAGCQLSGHAKSSYLQLQLQTQNACAFEVNASTISPFGLRHRAHQNERQSEHLLRI